MTEKGVNISVWQWLYCTIQFVAVQHVAVQPVANWLNVMGGQCDATQDAEDINKKRVVETLLRKHLSCCTLVTIAKCICT